MNENIAIFAYSWSNNYIKLDNYINQFVLNFQKIGYNIDVYIANQYVECDGIFGLNKNINIKKLNENIKSKKYKFVLSINNALLTCKLDSLRGQPVVDLIVDDFNHLFNHDSTGLYDQFIYADKILFSSHLHIKQLKLNNLGVVGRIYFAPTATSVTNKTLVHPPLPKKYNISWIASLLDTSGFILLCRKSIDSSHRIELLRNAIDITRRGGEISYDERIGGENLHSILLENGWSRAFFKMQIQNLISNETRVLVADKLSSLGLAIFGNYEWLNAVAYHSSILEDFRDGKVISSHDDIMEIYNSSKICINAPQVQSGSALPFRVMDIMASDALLITQYHPESDIFSIFGKECPVVMYKNLDELSELCEYYLSHEDERIRLVRLCNEMVRNGFDFRDRCLDILKLVGISAPSNQSMTGNIEYIDHFKFVFFSKKIKVFVKLLFIKLIKKMFFLIPLRLRRSLIINLT